MGSARMMNAMTMRTARTLVACLAVVAVLTAGGCMAGGRALGAPVSDGIPQGQSSHTLDSGGITRSFRLYRPAGLDAAAPLVVMLHGGFGDGTQAERAYNWDSQADSGHFVVAYPDGLHRAWNAGSCCGLPQRTGVDDVAFITAMVADIEARMPIDSRRVYATGMSNGAMMALRLGCQSTLFAAIAPVAGTLLTDCAGAQPASVLQIHGTADDRVPYGGGPGRASNVSDAPRVDGPSVESVNATWRSIDGCAEPTVTVSGQVTTQVAGCADGRTVELITVAGAGHQWPGGVPSPLAQRLGDLPPPSNALDATATIWQFFTQHQR